MYNGKEKRQFDTIPSLQLNGGFTLVELLVAISIFSIIVVPLLGNFIAGAKANAKAKKMQMETILAQNILEDVKNHPLEEIARKYNDPVEFGTDPAGAVRDGSFFFARRNIEYGGYMYDVLITLDPTPYLRMEDSGKPTGYNNFQMPILSQITREENVLAMQSFLTADAVTILYSNYIAYLKKQEELHKDDNPPFETHYYTPEDLERHLHKRIIIQANKVMDEVNVNVEFIYSVPDIEGCGMVSFPVAEGRMDLETGGVYVFYLPSSYDTVFVETNGFLPNDPYIDVYVIKQESDTESLWEKVEEHSASNVNLYSNASFTVNDLVKKEPARNRIYQVQVALYEANNNFAEDALSFALSSTKED